MAVLGYIFIAIGRDAQISVGEQQQEIMEYGKSLGMEVEEYFIEQNCSLKSPFRERKEAGKLLEGIGPGDSIVSMKSEWVLGSAREGVRLIKMLAKKSVSLHCVDLKENISLASERKLVVSEGASSLILTLLKALSVCENSKHGESIKATKRYQKKEGKYLGGPVPFGWRVEGDFLVQDVQQQRIIREISKLRSDRWSYRDIVEKLVKKHNVKLSHEGIRRILAHNVQRKEAEKKRELGDKSKKNPKLVSHKEPMKVVRQS